MTVEHPRLAPLDPLKGATRSGPSKPVPSGSRLGHGARTHCGPSAR